MPQQDPDLGRHPRGTLMLGVLYGVLFVLGWLAIFLFIYLPRGPVTG